MKKLWCRLIMICIMVLFLPVLSFADSQVTFQWDAVSDPDLAGYRLYQATASGLYVFGGGSQVGVVQAGTETITIHNIPDGLYFWVVTSFDTSGNESGPSNEVTANLDTVAPGVPTTLIITEWAVEAQ